MSPCVRCPTVCALLFVTVAVEAFGGEPVLRGGDGRIPRGEEQPPASKSQGLFPRRLVESCLDALNTSTESWVITCSGQESTCQTPYCPAGYQTDDSKDECTIEGWTVPRCIAWTTRVMLYGGATPSSVDFAYPIKVVAIGKDGAYSTAEYRQLIIQRVAESGAIDQWTVSLNAGEALLYFSHTVPEAMTFRLSAGTADYWDPSIEMGSLNMTYKPGNTSQYVFSSESYTGTVDSPVAVRVEAQDQYGNFVPTEQRPVSVEPSSSNATSTGVNDFVDGFGTATVSATKPGSYQVRIVGDDSMVDIIDYSHTAVVQFAVGATCCYVFQTPNTSSFVAGSMAKVTVWAEDQFGNQATHEEENVTVLASGGTGAGPLDIIGGSGSLHIRHTVAEQIVLSLSDTAGTGYDVSSTLNLRFTPAEASSVEITADPSAGTVDAPLSVVLRALDQFGNQATSEDRAVKVHADGLLVSSDQQVWFLDGHATTTISSQKAQVVEVSLQDEWGTGLDVSTTISLDFAAGAPTTINMAAPLFGTAGEQATINLTVLDQYENLVTAGLSGTSIGVVANGTSVTYDNVAQLASGSDELSVDTPLSQTVLISLADTFGTGLDVSAQRVVVFRPAAAAKYVLTSQQSSVSVDSSIQLTVLVQDQFDNFVSTYQEDVSIAKAGSGATLVTVTNGQGSTQVSHTVAELVTFSLVDSQSTGMEVSDTLGVTFTPGAPTSVRFAPGQLVAGTVDGPLQVSVEAVDQYGNVATSENRQVSIQPDNGISQVVTFVSGRASAFIGSSAVGTVEVSLEDSAGTGLDVSARLTLTFAHGATCCFVFQTPAQTNYTVGTSVTITVHAQDSFGHLATSEGQDVAVVQSRGTGGGEVDIVAGAGSFSVVHTVAENLILSLDDVDNTGFEASGSITLTFSPAQAASVEIVVDSSTGTVDDALSVTLRAKDQYGNLATSEDRSIKVHATGDEAKPEHSVTFVGGIATTSIWSRRPQVVTVSLVDSFSTGLDVSTTETLTFSAGAATKVNLEAPESGVAGSPATLNLTVWDQYGNLVTTGLSGLSVSVLASAASAATVSNNGIAQLSGGSTALTVQTTTAETVLVTVSDTFNTGLDVSGQHAIVFQGGVAVRYVVSAQVSGQTSASVDNQITLSITAQDQYGNIDAAMQQSVSIVKSIGQSRRLSSASTYAVSMTNGQGTALVGHTVAQTVTFTLTDSAGTGLDVSSTLKIVFTPGGTTAIVFKSGHATDGSVDDVAQITLQAVDQYGNEVTSESRSVRLLADGGNPQTVAFNGGGQASAPLSSTTVTSVLLTLQDSFGTGLDVSDSLTFSFQAGAPETITISAPASSTAGDQVAVTLTALDQYGNAASTGPSAVTLVASSPATVPGGGVADLQDGSESVVVTSTIAASISLSLQDTSNSQLTMNTASIVFVPGPAVGYDFALDSISATVDAPAEVTVNAVDLYGNVANQAQGDVTVVASAGLPSQLVDIVNGAGEVSISHTLSESVVLSLNDSQSTGLDVSAASSQVIFAPGVGRSVAFAAGASTATVGQSVTMTLAALDQYGNSATSEGRAVGVLIGSSYVGTVSFVAGVGQVAVTSTTAGPSTVSLSDPDNTSLDVSATTSIVFEHGAMHQFKMTSVSGAATAVVKVNQTFNFRTHLKDVYGNIVIDQGAPEIEIEAEVQAPSESEVDATWSLTNGEGVKDWAASTSGLHSVRIASAWFVENGNRNSSMDLDTAVEQSAVFTIDAREDLVPPDYSALSVSLDDDAKTAAVGIKELTEPADIWCVAANAGGPNSTTPGSTTEALVYAALLGQSTLPADTPTGRGGPFTTSGQVVVTNLQAGIRYEIRCAAADNQRNHMSGTKITERQLSAYISNASAAGSDDDGWNTSSLIASIVVVIVAVLLCCGALFILWRSKQNLEKANEEMNAVVPVAPRNISKASAQDSVEIAVAIDTAAAKTAPVVDTEKRGATEEYKVLDDDEDESAADDDDDDNKLDAEAEAAEDEEDQEMLAAALAMQQELMEELQKRGVLEEDSSDDEDHHVDDPEMSAILRDVKAFLGKQGERRLNRSNTEISLPMPRLPLQLGRDDEARIACLLDLPRPDGNWEHKMETFDRSWSNVGGPWAEARPRVRNEQLNWHAAIEAAKSAVVAKLQELERHNEAYEATTLDALSAEEAHFAKGIDVLLRKLHLLAMEWPEEDAKLRDAIIDEWAPKIKAAKGKVERQDLRTQASAALRQMEAEREEALEVAMKKLEDRGSLALERMQKQTASAWHDGISAFDTRAGELRGEYLGLRLQVVQLCRQAEEAALGSALQLRGAVRNATVEAETSLELMRIEEELSKRRASIENTVVDGAETAEGAEWNESKLRALHALDRAVLAARKAAKEETKTRQKHWQETLADRSRDRLRATRKRAAEEERRLMEEAAGVEDAALEVQSRRLSSLLLGTTHRAEAATLTLTAAVRRSQILMGLQATCSASVAQERLPRKEKAEGSAGQKERRGSREHREADEDERAVDELDDEMAMTGSGSGGSTRVAFFEARKRYATELNEAVGSVANHLAAHGDQQRSLLACRHRREALLASLPDGDDENREDLLDALEENLRHDVRKERWHHQAESSEALVCRHDGQESELGVRLAAVMRDSEHLEKERRIRHRYDQLRARILQGNQADKGCLARNKSGRMPSKLKVEQSGELLAVLEEEETYDESLEMSEALTEVKLQRAEALEKEAAELLRRAELDDLPADGQVAAAALGSLDPNSGRKKVPGGINRQKSRERKSRHDKVLRQAKQLQGQGKKLEAMRLLAATLDQERTKLRDEGNKEAVDMTWAAIDAEDDDAIKEPSEEKLQYEARLQRLADATAEARQLEGEGKVQEATELLLAAMAQDAAEDQEQTQDLLDEACLAELEKQRQRAEKGQSESKKRREMAILEAHELQVEGKTQEATELLMKALTEECAQMDAEAQVEQEERHEMSKGERPLFFEDELIEQELEAQQKRAEERRATRKQRLTGATAEAEALKAEGKMGAAMRLLIVAMLKEDGQQGHRQSFGWCGVEMAAGEEMQADGSMETGRRSLQADGGDDDTAALLNAAMLEADSYYDAVAADLQAQGKRLLDRRAARRQQAEAKAKALQEEAAALREEAAALREEAAQKAANQAAAQDDELERQRLMRRRRGPPSVRISTEEAPQLFAELSRNSLAGSEQAAPEFDDPILAWQQAARHREGAAPAVDAIQHGLDNAARRLLGGRHQLDLEGDKESLKQEFASEMERYQASVKDELEAQRMVAKRRLEARRLKREEERKQQEEQQHKRNSAGTWKKFCKATTLQKRAVDNLRSIHTRRLSRDSEVEERVRMEVKSEIEALKAEIRKLKGEERKKKQEPAMPTADDLSRTREVFMMKINTVCDEVEQDKQMQAKRLEARLAARRKNRAAKENEARAELEKERERLQAKDEVGNKDLLKDLQKMNNLIHDLQVGAANKAASVRNSPTMSRPPSFMPSASASKRSSQLTPPAPRG